MLLLARRATLIALISAGAAVVGQESKAPAPEKTVHEMKGLAIHLAPEGADGESWTWSVPPGGGTNPTAIFWLHAPLTAQRVRVKLEFLKDRPETFFRKFSLSATRDAQPSATSHWEPLFPVWFRSTEGRPRRLAGHLVLEGHAVNPDMQLEASLPFEEVTALKLEVLETASDALPAVLTRLHLERVTVATTNVALGCPVSATHPLPADMRPGYLTDGLADTQACAPSPIQGERFNFEIDLKNHQHLDHLHFRFKSDAQELARFSQVRLELYDEKPGPGVRARWRAFLHPHGTHPQLSQNEVHEVIRAEDGKGVFAGRYLRISSDSDVPHSPQIAEVEAYPVLLPLEVTALVGGKVVKTGRPLEISAGSSWIAFMVGLPEFPNQVPAGGNWRIEGFRNEWQPFTSSGIMESRSPEPGNYTLQVVLQHTDGVWNQTRLDVPLIVLAPLWQRPWVRLSIAICAPAFLALLTTWIGNRVMTRRVAQLERNNELSAERARIARDMHDAVGSQLTQLTVMHEIMADDEALSAENRGKLRQLANTARASVAALDEVVWAVNPGNDTLANLAAYLTHAAREYLRPLGIVCRQDVPPEWPDLHVPSHIRHQIFLAFREALHNVVKHAQADAVTVTARFFPQDSLMVLSIADDGIGLPADTIGVEKDGLDNMRDRLAKIGGNCRIRLRTGSGTVVEMKVPLPS